jgi:tRNA G37 N-methylase Trm5
MFCAGNITEKQRIAHGLPQSTLEEVVLDLYAGIGYFVFPYILYRPTRLLYACEWNPYSVEALERGLQHNAIPFIRLTSPTQPFNNQFKHDNEIRVRNELVDGDVKVVVCPGDNATYVSLYECKVDRVNLGLLPHSDDGWPLAVRALKPSGGYLHVHVNLKKGEEAVFQERLVAAVMELLGCWKQGVWWVRVLHMECVKSFAPRVYHWVADVECRPVDGQRAKVSGQE